MRSTDTFIALNRFGLGAGPGDDARVGDDPRGWVKAQIVRDLPLPGRLRGFRSTDAAITLIRNAELQDRETRQQAVRTVREEDFWPGLLARAAEMVTTETPLVERMVAFWANHFTVSVAGTGNYSGTIPAYIREAIRPHVFGRFADMLRATAQHPTMLTYLDNTRSVGAESQAGRNRQRRNPGATTLNENYARELLELHTLGVGGGYQQADVISLANILTGWSHGGYRRGGDEPVHGRFQFVVRQHQPGPKTVLGVTYPEAGVDEGLQVLDALARHPATARHVATKLVRHFVADDPPAAAVETIAAVFRDTEGDLAEVTAALVDLDAAWQNPLAKAKTHEEFLIALHRAVGHVPPERGEFVYPLRLLGTIPLHAPSPQGWGDRAGDWISPEALMIRLEFTHAFVARRPRTLIPQEVLDASIGAVARDVTATWVERAPSGVDGLTMIFASPEFQRR